MNKPSALEWVTTIVTIIGLCFIGFQLKQSNNQLNQSNEHKRWDNYNSMNTVYRTMFTDLQNVRFSNLRDKCGNYNDLNHHEKAWIRSYYNLYAEEYDLDEAGLLPAEMMDKTISNGFRLNLRTYPSIAEGFFVLMENGAFTKEGDFARHVEREIRAAGKVSECKNQMPIINNPAQ